MVSGKDIKDLEKKSKDAFEQVKKILKNVNTTVSRDIGKVKLKFREGLVVKKARLDLASGLKSLAKKIEDSARKIKK